MSSAVEVEGHLDLDCSLICLLAVSLMSAKIDLNGKQVLAPVVQDTPSTPGSLQWAELVEKMNLKQRSASVELAKVVLVDSQSDDLQVGMLPLVLTFQTN